MGKIINLTLFFHLIINTKTEIRQLSYIKNFFDIVPLLYDTKILNSNKKQWFNSSLKSLYVLNNVKTLIFEILYKDVNTYNNINDKIKVYFISPSYATVNLTYNHSKSCDEFHL